MNQDQVKQQLLKLKSNVEDFKVIFSGKKSSKVDGLYHPESKEIIIHNKNLKENNELMYTAIHEFAHHIHFTTSQVPISKRSHTTAFWNIFHTLLFQAERAGIYNNIFNQNADFIELTRKIKREIFSVNGNLMKELGGLLLEGVELCRQHHVSFGDYLDRILNLPRSSASLIIKTHSLNLNPEIGFENMKTLARINDSHKRTQAQSALLQGESSSMVKSRFMGSNEEKDPFELLVEERSRIQKQIRRLNLRLKEIEKKISSL